MVNYKNVGFPLTIYGVNLVGGFVAGLMAKAQVFNPVGGLAFGLMNRANLDHPAARIVRVAGSAYYTVKAVSHAITGVQGSVYDLSSAVLDASMAYQLIKESKNAHPQGIVSGICDDVMELFQLGHRKLDDLEKRMRH